MGARTAPMLQVGGGGHADQSSVRSPGMDDELTFPRYTCPSCGEHTVVPGGYGSNYPYADSGKMAGGNDAIPLPDPLIWMAYVAAATKRIKLATGILILPQHQPVLAEGDRPRVAEGERAPTRNPLQNFQPQTEREAALYQMILSMQREMAELRKMIEQRNVAAPREGVAPREGAPRPNAEGERPAPRRDGEK